MSQLQHVPDQFKKLSIENVRENIVGIDTHVPLLDGSTRQYINLDNAASTPALRPVLNKVTEFMDWYSSVHRGTGFKSQVSTQVYEEAHEIACQFVNANPETNASIFGKNTTESLNKLARRYPFQDGDVVLTTLMEHHSNDLPWRNVAQVEHIGVTDTGALDEDHFDSLLKQHGRRVRMVVVTGASNVTGFINPIHRLAEKAHAVGAEITIDAAQFAPHRKVDMLPDDDPQHLDYVVLTAHKMYAPYGASALIGKKTTFLQGDPDFVGGGTVDIVTTDFVKWAGLPDREEAGSPNVVGAVAQAKTMLTLQEIGMDAIAEHEAHLTSCLLKKLNKINGVTIYGSSDPARASERVGVVPFTVDGISHYLLAAILSVEGGIGVRNGCFCAHPYLFNLLKLNPDETQKYHDQIMGGSKAALPGLVRASFGCYSNEEDVDWFIEMLEKVIRKEYKGEYIQDPVTGEYTEKTFKPEIFSYFSL